MSEDDVYLNEARQQLALGSEWSEWEKSVLYRRRADEIKDRVEHPAIWDKLMMIEAKMDKVIALLESNAKPD